MLQAVNSTASISFNAPTLGSWVAIATAIVGLLFSAFNSGSEIAYFSLNKTDLESIPDDVKREEITAKVDNGVLTVELPKVVEEKVKVSRQIDIV